MSGFNQGKDKYQTYEEVKMLTMGLNVSKDHAMKPEGLPFQVNGLSFHLEIREFQQINW